jgi:hypothetical protein
MRWTFGVAIFAAVLALAGCSTHATTTSPTGAKSEVTVTPACNAAMKAIVNEGPNAANATVTADDDATLTACQTEAEWLLAASAHQSSRTDHCVVCGSGTPEDVLSSFCRGEMSKPACSR